MKRDSRLQGLSSDHHQGLVLARRVASACAAGAADADLVESVRRTFDRELAPHFLVEEELLLPALRVAGEGALATRTLREHAEMRDHLRAAEGGEGPRLSAFAELLHAHIRFEERELFPAAERLPSVVLNRVSERAPHPTRS